MFNQSGNLTFQHYIVINGKAHFLMETGTMNPADLQETFLYHLNEDYLFFPNWEAVVVSVCLEHRPDRNTSRCYVPAEVSFAIKRKIKSEVFKIARERYATTTQVMGFEWVELPANEIFEGLQDFYTFTRDEEGQWISGDVSVDRAIYAKTANPFLLGVPGGPCKVIQEIDEASLPPKKKVDLVKTVERGKDLSNADASKVYEKEVVRLGGDKIKRLGLTNHAQYRMDYRGVTLDDIKAAFKEFERWLTFRKQNPSKIKPKDRKIMEDLAWGESVEFNANRSGITIVFAMPESDKARLVSTWKTGINNPRPPKPGECGIVVGGVMADEKLRNLVADLSNVVDGLSQTFKKACGGNCDCGGSCGCGGNCGCNKDTESYVETEYVVRDPDNTKFITKSELSKYNDPWYTGE